MGLLKSENMNIRRKEKKTKHVVILIHPDRRHNEKHLHEASTKPSLALELDTFKAAVRRVVRNYVPEHMQGLFEQSPYQADKRLRDIGINNHTAAISAILDTTGDPQGHLPIEQAIIKQRTATTGKVLEGMLQTNIHNDTCGDL